jgi:hypothetical protein
VPFLNGATLVQTLIAFATIAMLGLLLRWTFGHDRTRTPPWPGTAEPATGSDPEDFGLLAPVGTVDTLEEAHRMRAVLAQGGVKATAARRADGRYRVLVFASELRRARRVGGWSA